MTDPFIEIYDKPIHARFWIYGQWTGVANSPLEGSLSPIQHSDGLGSCRETGRV